MLNLDLHEEKNGEKNDIGNGIDIGDTGRSRIGPPMDRTAAQSPSVAQRVKSPNDTLLRFLVMSKSNETESCLLVWLVWSLLCLLQSYRLTVTLKRAYYFLISPRCVKLIFQLHRLRMAFGSVFK